MEIFTILFIVQLLKVISFKTPYLIHSQKQKSPGGEMKQTEI